MVFTLKNLINLIINISLISSSSFSSQNDNRTCLRPSPMAIEKCLHILDEINECENRRTEIVFLFLD